MKWKIIVLLTLLLFSNSTIAYAQDDSQLIIDGTTEIELTELEATSITLRDNASLTIQNIHQETIFYNDSNTIKFRLYDDSNLVIINSRIPASVELFNSSRVEIINSTVFHAFWCPIHMMFHNGSGIFSHDYSSFTVIDSKIGYIRGDGNNVGNVAGGSVMEIWSSGGMDADFDLYVERCRVGRVHLTEPQRRLFNIRIGYYEDLLFDQQVGVSIQLHKTELTDGVSVTFSDSRIEIDDCDIVVLDAFNCSRVEVADSYIWDIALWHPEYVELVNCSVDYFCVINWNICEIFLDNCFIDRFDGHVSHFYRLNATDSVIDDFYQGRRAEMVLNGMKVEFHDGDMEYLSLCGDFNLENNTLPVLVLGHSLNVNITVQRVFPVILQYLNVPVEDALVEFLDGDEVVVSTLTDSNGYAEIQLRFFEGYRNEENDLIHYSNLTKSYTLRVVDHESEYMQTIGVYSITPIIVEAEGRVDKTVLLSIAVLCLFLSLVLIRKLRV